MMMTNLWDYVEFKSDGCIWCVATDDLFSNKKYKIQLIRQGRKWVDKLVEVL